MRTLVRVVVPVALETTMAETMSTLVYPQKGPFLSTCVVTDYACIHPVFGHGLGAFSWIVICLIFWLWLGRTIKTKIYILNRYQINFVEKLADFNWLRCLFRLLLEYLFWLLCFFSRLLRFLVMFTCYRLIYWKTGEFCGRKFPVPAKNCANFWGPADFTCRATFYKQIHIDSFYWIGRIVLGI